MAHQGEGLAFLTGVRYPVSYTVLTNTVPVEGAIHYSNRFEHVLVGLL